MQAALQRVQLKMCHMPIVLYSIEQLLLLFLMYVSSDTPGNKSPMLQVCSSVCQNE